MGLPLALFVAGSALSYVGRTQQREAQAAAERANGEYYLAQQQFEMDATDQEVHNFDRQSAHLRGEQLGSIAGSGITFSATALETLAGNQEDMTAERQTIIYNGAFKAKLAGLRAQASFDSAASVNSPIGQLADVARLGLDIASIYKS